MSLTSVGYELFGTPSIGLRSVRSGYEPAPQKTVLAHGEGASEYEPEGQAVRVSELPAPVRALPPPGRKPQAQGVQADEAGGIFLADTRQHRPRR